MDAINDRSGNVEQVESNFSMDNLKEMLSFMAGYKPSTAPKIAGCRNCGDLFDIVVKQKCNCGNVDFSLFNGGEATIKAEKGMKQLRSWKQNKRK